MMPSQQHGEKEANQLEQKINHIKALNKLTPKAKTDMILELQDKANRNNDIDNGLRIQIDRLLTLKDEQIKTISNLNTELGRKDREITQLKDAYIDKLELIVELYEGKL